MAVNFAAARLSRRVARIGGGALDRKSGRAGEESPADLLGNTGESRMNVPDLYWLPDIPDFGQALRSIEIDTGRAWQDLIRLANGRLDFVATNRLDRRVRALFPDGPPPGLPTGPVRLAVLSSSTADHFLPAIRIAGLRRGLWIE